MNKQPFSPPTLPTPMSRTRDVVSLLESACRTLEEYFGPDGDEIPVRVREWWTVRKREIIKGRIEKSEAGVADAALQEITCGNECGSGLEGIIRC